MKAETKPAYDNTQTGTGEQHPVVDELRRLLAEMIGTFALTMVAAGGEVIAVVSGGEVSHAARMVAPGLLVMAMTYALANLSGAHFNPVVTLAFTVAKK